MKNPLFLSFEFEQFVGQVVTINEFQFLLGFSCRLASKSSPNHVYVVFVEVFSVDSSHNDTKIKKQENPQKPGKI